MVHENLLLFSALDTRSQKLLAKKNTVWNKPIYLVQSLLEYFIERCCKSNKLLQKEYQHIIHCLYDDLYEQGHHFSYSFEASRTFGQGPSDTRGKKCHGPPRILAGTWTKHFLSNDIFFLLDPPYFHIQSFAKKYRKFRF